MSREKQLADAARAWRDASYGTEASTTEQAERTLADHLEVWIAEQLQAEPAWHKQGRWFDGLVFLGCRVKGERFDLSGYIWSIEQEKWPFRASLQLSPEGLAHFDVRFGDSDKQKHDRSQRWSLPAIEPEWAFRFTKSV